MTSTATEKSMPLSHAVRESRVCAANPRRRADGSFMRSALVISMLLGAAPAFADRGAPRIAPASETVNGFRCPGDNPSYFEEIQESGWVGFGETWDFDVCDDGAEVYAAGANRRWRAMRPKLANRQTTLPSPIDAEDVLFYSTVLPYGAFGTLGLVFAIAWIVSLLQRKKQAPTVVVTCSGCQRGVPVRPEEGGVFCPACGTIALVDVVVGNPSD